jgi:hypothetical protein
MRQTTDEPSERSSTHAELADGAEGGGGCLLSKPGLRWNPCCSGSVRLRHKPSSDQEHSSSESKQQEVQARRLPQREDTRRLHEHNCADLLLVGFHLKAMVVAEPLWSRVLCSILSLATAKHMSIASANEETQSARTHGVKCRKDTKRAHTHNGHPQKPRRQSLCRQNEGKNGAKRIHKEETQ